MQFDEKDAQLLDRFFQEDYHSNEPGAAILIVLNENIVYQRCFGLANVENNEAITSNTNFRLASLTKQFTAYGIDLLENENKLSKNDSIGKYFSDEFNRKCPLISRKITIQHLLDHSSGLIDYEEYNLSNDKQWSNQDVLDSLEDKTLFEPGIEYRYSNTGYILLGLIIENISSKALGKFFHDSIFQLFHMKTSILYNSIKPCISDRAFGYIKENDSYQLCDQSLTSATSGDGGLYMSLNDYFQWYRHYPLVNTRLAYPIMSTKYFYQSGWFLSDSTGQIRLHTGNSCGFTHQVYRIDENERKVLVLYLTNIGNHGDKIRKFNRFILENYPRLNPNNTELLWQIEGLTR